MADKWTVKDVLEHANNLKSPFENAGKGGKLAEPINDLRDRVTSMFKGNGKK